MSLIQFYGDRILLDYRDKPINTPPPVRNRNAFINGMANLDRDFGEVGCIHGHFMPVKYLPLETKQDLTYVTWMRNPVERIISHYYFWQRRNKPDFPPLYKRVIEEKWSLERFCLSNEMRNLYHQFLWGFPVFRFDFIGITEYYDEDYRYFSENILQGLGPAQRVNVNKHIKKKYPISKSLRREIEDFHHDDMELYHMALEKRKENKKGIFTNILGMLKI
jgi:hypothetical protein